MSEYESFSVYGFSTVYPSTWKIEFDPKSDRKKGNVAFKSPENDNVFLSWGSLKKAKTKYTTEEHAKDSIKAVRKNPRVSKVETVQTKELRVQSHRAIYSLVRVVSSIPSAVPFRKGVEEVLEIRSLHIHCDVSKRYYVLYGQNTLNKSMEHENIFSNMGVFFKCHGQ